MEKLNTSISFLKRAAMIALLPVSLVLLIACQTAHGPELNHIEDLDTWIGADKIDVYKNLGLPDSVSHFQDFELLHYASGNAKGGGLILGSGPANISINRFDSAVDSRVIVIDSSDQVKNVHNLSNSDFLSYRFWPFSEYR